MGTLDGLAWRGARLTRATITNIINEFIQEGLVLSTPQCSTSHSYLQINPHALLDLRSSPQGAVAKVAVLTPDMAPFGKAQLYPSPGHLKKPWVGWLETVNALRSKSMT